MRIQSFIFEKKAQFLLTAFILNVICIPYN